MDMLRTNPKVCFQVEEFKNMADWKSVIAFGEFEELTDPEERSKGMQVLLDRTLPLLSSQTTHLGTYWPFRPEDLNSIPGVVFRLRLADKTGRFERPDVTPQ
jgi:nitroimidazol reductase NimA-like FMN-containing flavoprotein (pyridoxamine 5'-phosphate oxidase superfamily)